MGKDICSQKIYKWPVSTGKLLTITNLRKMQIQTAMRYHFTLIRKAMIINKY